MRWPIFSIFAYVKNVDSWTLADWISLGATLASLLLAYIAYRSFLESRKANKTTHRLMIEQMNRGERIRIYAIALAGMKARSAFGYQYVKRVKLLFPPVANDLYENGLPSETESNVKLIDEEQIQEEKFLDDNMNGAIARVRTVEFNTEFDLLASENVINIWNTLQSQYDDGRIQFNHSVDSIQKDLDSGDLTKELAEERLATAKEVRVANLALSDETLFSLREKIIKELEISPSMNVSSELLTTGENQTLPE